MNQATENEETEEKSKYKLASHAAAQFAEWAKHKPGERNGGNVYLRLCDIRHETSIDSRSTPTQLIETRNDSSATTSDDLMSSIATNGLNRLIMVGKDKVGYFRVGGNRRHSALVALLGEKAIVECIYNEVARKEHLYASGVDNINWKKLSVPDLADYLTRVADESGDTQQQIADRFGISMPHVSNLIRIRKAMTTEDITRWQLNPEHLTVNDALTCIKSDREKDPNAKVNFWRGPGNPNDDPEAKAKREKAKRAREVEKVFTSAKSYVMSNLEQRDVDMILRGYKLAKGEPTDVELSETKDGKVVVELKK